MAESCSDGKQFAPSKTTHSHGMFLSQGKTTDASTHSRSGMTYEPLTENNGLGLLTWFLEGSRAKTLARQEKGQESTGKSLASGKKWPASFARLDPISCSWKTHQPSLLAGLDEFLGTWPKWGSMQGGECSELTAPAFRIIEPECGWLPTPSGVNGGKNHVMGRLDEWGGSSNPLRGTPLGKVSPPELEEQLMGWPTGWTAPTASVTDKFQSWMQSHG